MFFTQETATNMQGEPGKLLACSLPWKARMPWLIYLGVNYHQPQGAISQWMILNMPRRAAHTAVGLSVPPQMTKKISDFTAMSLHPFTRL